MIKSIMISNFKCFKKEVLINFSDLTLISGLNNSGKSTIYQMLLLLKQSINNINYATKMNSHSPNLKLNGDILQLGNPDEVLNDINKNLSVTVEYDDSIKLSISYKLIKSTSDTEDDENQKAALVLDTMEIIDKDSSFSFERRNDQYYVKSYKCLSFDYNEFNDYFFDYLKKKCQENDMVYEKLEDLLSDTVEFTKFKNIICLNFLIIGLDIDISQIVTCINEKYRHLFLIDEFQKLLLEKEYDENFISLRSNFPKNLIRLQQEFTDEINFVLPFRGYPKRVYVETEYPNPLLFSKNDMANKISYKFDIDSMQVVLGTLSDALKYWIKNIITNIDSFKINTLVEGLISETIVTEKNRNISIMNVGFGISQILPLIVNVLLCHKNSICIIDEPEVHLHPSLQTRLADFFVEMIKLGKKLIVETHSEYIINRVLYHKLLNTDKTIEMLWVVKEENESHINEMKCDDLGFIINKPEGFLDENDNIVQLLNDERSKRL
ncbi:hypothetical protein AGMMS49587_13460 [Spirochaetia bacterium]|nr:hypothetical protein AGMMS49587_13460 [Spirochaetia bacterium]